MKQSTFADLEYDAKKKRTRREKFLAEMNQVVPWARWLQLIEPHYPKAGLGRRPMPLERMLRIYLLQQWFNLSDPAMEEMLIDSESMRRFAGINLMDDPVPDETTILKFRHLLEKHSLTEQLFRDVGLLLTARGLLLHQGTIVDATIISAPPSTKNRDLARDPEMSQTKKRNTWYFGMKAHIGVDLDSGLVHTLVTPRRESRIRTCCRSCCMGRRTKSWVIVATVARRIEPWLAKRESYCTLRIEPPMAKNSPCSRSSRTR